MKALQKRVLREVPADRACSSLRWSRRSSELFISERTRRVKPSHSEQILGSSHCRRFANRRCVDGTYCRRFVIAYSGLSKLKSSQGLAAAFATKPGQPRPETHYTQSV